MKPSTFPVTSPAPDLVSIDDLHSSIVSLAARINAETYELLVLVRQFDERAGWMKWGLGNCAEWLHYYCDFSMNAARVGAAPDLCQCRDLERPVGRRYASRSGLGPA